MQHRHMDTNHTYKYTIQWLTEKKPTYTYMSKQTEKNTTCTDIDTKKKVDYTS